MRRIMKSDVVQCERNDGKIREDKEGQRVFGWTEGGAVGVVRYDAVGVVRCDGVDGKVREGNGGWLDRWRSRRRCWTMRRRRREGKGGQRRLVGPMDKPAALLDNATASTGR